VPAKRFEYAAAVDRAGRISAEGAAPLELGDEWTPEHLVLAGLARCTLASLTFHAQRAGLDLTASASAAGAVTKREEDGRYAFVEIDCRVEVELERELPGDELRALVEKAERDCFVGASLTVHPRYHWRVDGRDYSY
jgi:organic hydroperoxide reductase OsmC/OhrA